MALTDAELAQSKSFVSPSSTMDAQVHTVVCTNYVENFSMSK